MVLYLLGILLSLIRNGICVGVDVDFAYCLKVVVGFLSNVSEEIFTLDLRWIYHQVPM